MHLDISNAQPPNHARQEQRMESIKKHKWKIILAIFFLWWLNNYFEEVAIEQNQQYEMPVINPIYDY